MSDMLRQISGVLRSGCRDELDLVARYGGEEFAVILPATTEEGAHDVESRLATTVRMLDIPHVSSTKGCVTVSVGLVYLSATTDDPQQLLKRCDKALYLAKGAGRDKVRAAPKPYQPEGLKPIKKTSL